MIRGITLALLFVLSACAPAITRQPQTILRPEMTDRALVMEDGAVLPLRQWLPMGEPKAVLLALHGFNDYSNFFDLPAPKFTKAGIAVFAYDQRGFGRAPDRGHWAGLARMRIDLYNALGLIAARYPSKPLYVLGESMGGAMLLSALSPDQRRQVALPPISGVFLVAPAVWSRGGMPWYQSAALWIGDHMFPWMTLTGSGLHIQASDNIPMLIQMGRDPLVIKETRVDAIKGLCDLMDDASLKAAEFDLPGLVLLGNRDEVIPEDASAEMITHLPKNGPIVRNYPKGYHMLLRDLHADQPIGDILSLIDPAS
jgi:alpha-beta hydrolase superfamily lysophospholipase